MMRNAMMNHKLRKGILAKHFEIIEDSIVKGNYIDTHFTHYSQLVHSLVESVKDDSPIFFTGLCITPIEWYNFKIKSPNKSLVSDIEFMQEDPDWSEYIKFSNRFGAHNNNLYRCLFSVEDNFDKRTRFRKLAKNGIVRAHQNKQIIYKASAPVEPLEKVEILAILGDNIDKYSCYKDAGRAYLIVDDEDDVEFSPDVYECQRLWDHLGMFQGETNLKQWILKESYSISYDLPEDFFIIGTGSNLHDVKWKFALAGKPLTDDQERVRLWILEKGSVAKSLSNGCYKPEFNFDNLINFVDNVVIRNLETS